MLIIDVNNVNYDNCVNNADTNYVLSYITT